MPAYSREELDRIVRAGLAFRLDVLGLFLENRKTQLESITTQRYRMIPNT